MMKSPYVTIAHISNETGLTANYISELARSEKIKPRLINGFPLYCKLELGGSNKGLYLFMLEFADEVRNKKYIKRTKRAF